MSNETGRNQRLSLIAERCLESEAAYKLFDMLGAISQMDLEAKLEYVELVREAGVYSAEEIGAIERLILSGSAQQFKKLIDQRRDERVQDEIDVLLGEQPMV